MIVKSLIDAGRIHLSLHLSAIGYLVDTKVELEFVSILPISSSLFFKNFLLSSLWVSSPMKFLVCKVWLAAKENEPCDLLIGATPSTCKYLTSLMLLTYFSTILIGTPADYSLSNWFCSGAHFLGLLKLLRSLCCFSGLFLDIVLISLKAKVIYLMKSSILIFWSLSVRLV